MAGVPPDYFSATGQLWGNPVYDWAANAQENYRWWINRFRHLLTLVDWVRIDHFRGFESFWAVPQGEETAINGQWLPGPGAELFEAVQAALGKLPVIAEDLGIITPEVEALRDRFQFPGMKILQFAFDSGSGNPYLPHNYRTPNCVVYTGTHDNNTTVGWFNERSPEDQQRVFRYAGYAGPDGIQWDLTRMAMASVADWAIVPLQDCLGYGSDSRMNTPGQADGNWGWRCPEGGFAPWMADRLRDYADLYGRWGD
jgi:4-alpha-glucanotransferase